MIKTQQSQNTEIKTKTISIENNTKLNKNYHQDTSLNHSPYRSGYANIDKHIKDNSFKQSNSLIAVNIPLRKKNLNLIKDKASILELQVINRNSSIKKGTTLKITCQGLENGLNKREDGYTYFGYYPKDNEIPLDENKFYLLDYNLDFKDNKNNKNEQNEEKSNASSNECNNYGRHFFIEYNIENNIYEIKDLGNGFGVFYKLDTIYTLKDNQLINIGQIFIVVNISSDAAKSFTVNNSIASTQPNQLKLKVYGVNYAGDSFYFSPSNRNITIGRYELADVKLNDKLLSSIHCQINYTEKGGWKLFDGHNDKPSTNGTWIYINEGHKIYNKMIFKTNQTVFQANIINK